MGDGFVGGIFGRIIFTNSAPVLYHFYQIVPWHQQCTSSSATRLSPNSASAQKDDRCEVPVMSLDLLFALLDCHQNFQIATGAERGAGTQMFGAEQGQGCSSSAAASITPSENL